MAWAAEVMNWVAKNLFDNLGQWRALSRYFIYRPADLSRLEHSSRDRSLLHHLLSTHSITMLGT